MMQVVAAPAAFLVSNHENVERADGTRVKVEAKITAGEQLSLMWKNPEGPACCRSSFSVSLTTVDFDASD